MVLTRADIQIHLMKFGWNDEIRLFNFLNSAHVSKWAAHCAAGAWKIASRRMASRRHSTTSVNQTVHTVVVTKVENTSVIRCLAKFIVLLMLTAWGTRISLRSRASLDVPRQTHSFCYVCYPFSVLNCCGFCISFIVIFLVCFSLIKFLSCHALY